MAYDISRRREGRIRRHRIGPVYHPTVSVCLAPSVSDIFERPRATTGEYATGMALWETQIGAVSAITLDLCEQKSDLMGSYTTVFWAAYTADSVKPVFVGWLGHNARH